MRPLLFHPNRFYYLLHFDNLEYHKLFLGKSKEIRQRLKPLKRRKDKSLNPYFTQAMGVFIKDLIDKSINAKIGIGFEH